MVYFDVGIRTRHLNRLNEAKENDLEHDSREISKGFPGHLIATFAAAFLTLALAPIFSIILT